MEDIFYEMVKMTTIISESVLAVELDNRSSDTYVSISEVPTDCSCSLQDKNST